MNRPPQRRTARNVGIGVVLAGVIVGIGVREQMQAPPEPVPLEVPAKALGGPLLRDGFEGASGGAPVPPDACSGPLVKPAGFTAVPQTWSQMWSSKRKPSPSSPVPQAQFPTSPGFPVGIGAARWQYQLTSFIPPVGMTAQLAFDMHQARPQEGEPMGRPANSMFISISPCPGDFRIRFGCTANGNAGQITWTTGSNPPACPLTAGTTYYLLVAPVNPADGSVAGDYTCKDPNAPYCWVQARHAPK